MSFIYDDNLFTHSQQKENKQINGDINWDKLGIACEFLLHDAQTIFDQNVPATFHPSNK